REFADFGWRPEDVPDPQAESTWSASRLQWGERDEPEHAELLEWYRALLRLRPRLTVTGGGAVEVTADEASAVLVLRSGSLVVAVHAAAGTARAALPGGAHPALVWPPDGVHITDACATFDGEGVAVLTIGA
ncbi:MAG TPA: DUF3459 domain-containing protein, partial [Acidimicrobiales bacterium]|nr:DUF3459 domain-containing protein [Acidimicrobiales bacterium]